MPLKLDQILEISENPRNKAAIREIRDHEERLRFFVEPHLTKKSAGKQADKHFEWIAKIFTTDITERYKELFVWPHPIVSECERAFRDLKKVNDGRNSFFSLVMSNPESQEYAEEVIESITYNKIKEDIFEEMTTSPNSVLVVDMPTIDDDSDLPYYYFVNAAHWEDFDVTDDCELKYIWFKQPNGYAVIDDGSYHLFEVEEGKELKEYSKYTTVPHSFDTIPALMFWAPYVSKFKKWLKRNPLSNKLGLLDWMLLFSMAEKHTDISQGFPQSWYYPEDEEEEKKDEVRGRENGVLPSDSYSYTVTEGFVKNTNKHPQSGPGKIINTPAPSAEDDIPNMAPPGGYIERDHDGVKRVGEKLRQICTEFQESVTGYSGEPVNNQAKNEKQVSSIYETRAAILNGLARHLERAEEWLVKMLICAVDKENFVSIDISKGTEYYLESPSELLSELADLRKKEMPQIILTQKEDQCFSTAYRHNPGMLERIHILNNLDPLRHGTKATAKELYDAGMMSEKDYAFKVMFSTLIARFERENGPITEFGTSIEAADANDPFMTRINTIKETIYSYIKITEPKVKGPEAPQIV